VRGLVRVQVRTVRRRHHRAQIRLEHALTPTVAEGVYGVTHEDAGADNWVGTYLMWARTPEEAKARITAAGFHRRRT
jgi:hypothetical protein